MSTRNIGLNKRSSARTLQHAPGTNTKTKARTSSVPYNHDDDDEGMKVRAAGLAGAGSTDATETLIDIVNHRLRRMVGLEKKDQEPVIDEATMDDREKAIRQAQLASVEDDDSKKKKVGFFALFSFSTAGERWWMAFGTIFAIISGLAMPVWLYLLAESLETFNNIGKLISAGADISIIRDELYKLIYSFAILGVVTLVSGSCYVASLTYTGEKQTLRIRQKFVHSAVRQDASWFDKKGDAQKLPIVAANGLNRINKAIGREVGDMIVNFLSGVGCLAVAVLLNAPLALIVICILPIIAAAIGIISCYMRKSTELALDSFGSAGAFATEVITGIKTVSSLSAELWALSTYEAYAREAQKYSIKSQYLSKLAAGITGFLFYVTYTFSFIFGTEQVVQRLEKEEEKLTPFGCMFSQDCGISGSEVMICIYGVMLASQFFAMLSPSLSTINAGRASAAEIYDAIKRTPEIDGMNEDKGTKLDGENGPKFDGSIEFKKVAFSYPTRPRDLIFTSFSLNIKPGSAVALVGPSGSGKSTLSKLILRMYDPIAGQVLVGGVPLTELNLKWWRSQIGYVAQEPSLIPGTIFDNIAAGIAGENGPRATEQEVSDAAATEQEVIEAAKAASAHEFISELPDGYNTFYNGSSIQLSGGQIQRIAIARALIRNPSVLLLDEATSALDTQSERSVQDALSNIRKTRKLTTVTVAHRLSTIVNSDAIAVVSEGYIQELGTHKELVAEGGIYAQLCEGQGLTADAGSTEDSPTEEPKEMAQDGAATNVKTVAAGNIDDVEEGLVTKDDSEDQEQQFEDELDTSEVLGRLWNYNKDETWYMLLGYTGAVLVGTLTPVEAILFGTITASYFTIEDPDELRENTIPLCLWFLLMAVVSLIANIAMGIGFGVSGFRLSRRIRVLTFERIIRHSMGWFDAAEHSAGELSTRLEEDSEAVSNLTGWQQGQRIQVCTSILVGMIIALTYSWQIGLIAIACVPFIVGASVLQARCAARRPAPSTDEHFVSAPTLLERTFNDIMVIQAYSLQDEISTKYSGALAPDSDFKKKQGVWNGLGFGFSQFSTFATFALIFYSGLQFIVQGTVGFLDFFVALLAVMFSAFAAGSAQLSSRKEGLQAAARIFELVDEPLDGDDPFLESGDKPEKLDGNVQFKECCFAYPTRPEAPVYYPYDGRDGFTLDIESKKSVAFTGRSGCGKSTALQLLMRFYRVTSGTVSLDNDKVEDLNLQWFRSQIGYVGQMPVLFNGTIRENILLGKPDATEEEILKAAKSANAHGFIDGMSKGYDTDIGVGGSLLSGGQKQRVAIARAIVKNPKILVLDEATSALDNDSEKIVQAALDSMQKEQPRTTLTVAHRLETVKNCDKIVVLDRGGVKECGPHSELLKQKGLYHKLWTKQGGKED